MSSRILTKVMRGYDSWFHAFIRFLKVFISGTRRTAWYHPSSYLLPHTPGHSVRNRRCSSLSLQHHPNYSLPLSRVHCPWCGLLCICTHSPWQHCVTVLKKSHLCSHSISHAPPLPPPDYPVNNQRLCILLFAYVNAVVTRRVCGRWSVFLSHLWLFCNFTVSRILLFVLWFPRVLP